MKVLRVHKNDYHASTIPTDIDWQGKGIGADLLCDAMQCSA